MEPAAEAVEAPIQKVIMPETAEPAALTVEEVAAAMAATTLALAELVALMVAAVAVAPVAAPRRVLAELVALMVVLAVQN